MKKILLSLLLVSFSTQAFAQASPDSVKKFVNDIGNRIVKTANENLTEKKKEDKIIAIIDTAIDVDWISKFVLAKNYKTSSEPQKERFKKLYRQFMINTYGPKFKNYNGRRFDVIEIKEQNSFYIAKSEFLPRDSDVAISVNFRVKEKDGKLFILDFVAEGVSLIETQRSEFNSAISQNGMDKFLDKLEIKVKNLRNSHS